MRFGSTDIDFSRKVCIMGVINVTPNSFSDGGQFLDRSKAVEHGLLLAGEGADILDVGGESSRPGADPVSADEEIRRVVPVIEALCKVTHVPISIDTAKSSVAEAALDAGASMVNDISAMEGDPGMAELAARRKCVVCLMHMKGTPKTMQKAPRYDDAAQEILRYLGGRVDFAVKAGIDKERIVVDPGIGFGKRLEDNLVLLNRLDLFKNIGCPILVGTSRKSFIGALLHEAKPKDRLYGTLGSIAVAVMRGANAVRVHDVKPVKEMLDVMAAITGESRA